MDEILVGKLLKAIKADDLNGFKSVLSELESPAVALGRFHVLSVVYLYNAKKIIAAYEDTLIKASSWRQIPEPFELANDFRKAAGKCLRLYLDEDSVVLPLEMLLILDRTAKVKALYPECHPVSDGVRQRLKDIYSLKYALDVTYEGNTVNIPKRPLGNREKKKILIAVLGAVLCIAIAVGTPFVVNAFVPFIGVKENDKGTELDFSGNETVVVDKDTVFIDTVVVDATSDIDGNGKTLTFRGSSPMFTSFSGTLSNATLKAEGTSAMFKNFGGKMENVTVELGDAPLFETLSGSIENCTFNTKGTPIVEVAETSASMEKLTVNVNASVTVSGTSSFVAKTNYGLIQDVSVNAKGTLTAATPVLEEEEKAESVIFGGIVGSNEARAISLIQVHYSTVNNCSVNFDDFRLVGNVKANAAFGGIAGVNNSYVKNCKTEGEGGITADTFDVAGICMENNGSVDKCTNSVNITQTTAQKDWNPIAAGVVMNNLSSISGCVNTGKITSVSECEPFEVGEDSAQAANAYGIAYTSYNLGGVYLQKTTISDCLNTGEIYAKANVISASSAGICGTLIGDVDSCLNDGSVTAETEGKGNAWVGGICSLSYGTIYRCVSSADLTAEAKNGSAVLGGLAAICGVTAVNYTACVGRTGQSAVKGKLTVISDGEESFLGGIAGKINEVIINAGTQNEYTYGGGSTYCCFIGETAVIGKATVGGNAGVAGKKIHDTNKYASGLSEYYYFYDNYFLCTDETLAIAKVYYVTEDDETVYETGSDLQATKGTMEELKGKENFNRILDIAKLIAGEGFAE